jgi:hypothetical protein
VEADTGHTNLLPRRLPIADRAELRQGDVIDLFVVPDSVVDWLKAREEEWTTCTGWDECHLGALDYIRVPGTRGGYHEQSKNSLIVDLKDEGRRSGHSSYERNPPAIARWNSLHIISEGFDRPTP